MQAATQRRIASAAVLGLGAWLMAGATSTSVDEPRATPAALVATDPVSHDGDAADDPAIWIHPTDPARSLVLGTDKKGGLDVFELDGMRLQTISDGSRPNNVDLLYGVALGGRAVGRAVDLAVASARAKPRMGVLCWTIEPEARRLTPVGDGPAFSPFEGGEPYGLCAYRSSVDGTAHVIVTDKDGRLEQYRLDGSGGTIRATKVRGLRFDSQCEGCVADNEAKALYVAEEDVGIWRLGAEPDSREERRLIAKVGEHGLKADVEGLAIYYARDGKGYLIASSQGSNTFFVYERDGQNAFVLTIDPKDGPLGDVGETDGIDVTNLPTSSRFNRGLFIAQDGKPRDGRQRFKLFAWDEIAGDRLRVEPGYRAGGGPRISASAR